MRVEIGIEARQKAAASMVEGLAMSCGMKANESDHNGFSLLELCRESLRVANQATGGHTMEVITRAMTTSDFPNILSNVASKSMLAGYEAEAPTWQKWCSVGSLPNFKISTLHRVSGADALDLITESEPYSYGTIDETKEEVNIATYGKLFAVTRHAIINDDLDALTNIPMAHGEAAARKIGDLVYSILTGNPTMGDGKTLFHTGHSNILTPAIIGESTLSEAIRKMALQKDSKGRALNVNPRFIIAPRSIEGAAEVFFGSHQFSDSDTASTRTNIYSGARFTRIYDARLDDASTTAWYVAADPGKTVKVFFLNGQQAPILEQQAGWNVDGIEYKVRIDAAAKALDWRGLSRNLGA